MTIERAKEIRADLLKKIQTDFKNDTMEDVIHAGMSLMLDLALQTGNKEPMIKLLGNMLLHAETFMPMPKEKAPDPTPAPVTEQDGDPEWDSDQP